MPETMKSASLPTVAKQVGRRVVEALRSVLQLEESVAEGLVVAFLAQGHALIEGIPGTGKTLLARTLAKALGLGFKRIQFTNDLMPSDIVGTSVWRAGQEAFSFVPGPLFSPLVLADEINRTSPRTLSCLLEAMEAGKVSVDGETRELASPFMVVATRNPIEFHGTFPIPEAALDRFLVSVEVSYPDVEGEVSLYLGQDPAGRVDALQAVANESEIREALDEVDQVSVAEPVARYAYRVVAATRDDPAVVLGASPRTAMSWLRAGRARALLQGRRYVLPDDLKALARSVLGHRVFLQGGGRAGDLIAEIISRVPVEL